DMAQGAVAGVGAGGERLAFVRAEAVGAGVEFAGREGGQEMRQPLGLRGAEEDSGTGQEGEGEDAKQPRGIRRYYEPWHAITLGSVVARPATPARRGARCARSPRAATCETKRAPREAPVGGSEANQLPDLSAHLI